MSIFNKIFRGTVANDNTGDPLREGGQIVNDNFDLAVARVDSVQNIAGLIGDYDGQQISLLGWHPDSDIGGGILYWDSGRYKSDHNGGTVFSPTVPWSVAAGDYLNGVGETEGAGTGVWVRADTGTGDVNLEWWGVGGSGLQYALKATTIALVFANGRKLIVSGDLLFTDAIANIDVINIHLKSGTRILSDGAEQWIRDCKNLTITSEDRCKVGDAGYLFSDNCIYWSNSSSIDMVSIGSESSYLTFKGDNTTSRLIACEGGTEGKYVQISKLILDGFVRSGIELPMSMTQLESKVTIDDCITLNASNLAGTRRGIQVGDNAYRSKSVTITRCKINGLGGSSVNEVKGILVYAETVFIDNNEVRDIKNSGGDDAEAIYVKALSGSITNNKCVNGGSSHDGVITTKGDSWVGANTYAGLLVVANNTIELDDISYEVNGMSINTNNTIITGNTLRDLRQSRDSLNYCTSIGLGISNYVNNCIVSDNISDGWKYFIGSPYQESDHARLVNNNKIDNNTCVNMSSYPAIIYRPDNKITDTMTFTASTNTISIDNDNQEFNFYSFSQGDEIEVFGTVSNNNVYVIDSVSQYSITVTSGIINETSVSAQLIKNLSGTLKINNNIFHSISGLGSAIRQRSRKNKSISIDGNTYIGYVNACQFDISNCADVLNCGSSEDYSGISGDSFTATPSVSTLNSAIRTSTSTGTNTTPDGTIEVSDPVTGEIRYLLTASTLN